jgi:hypothetical protein
MAALQQTSLRNQLLAGLLPEDFALLQPHLDSIALALRRVLLEPKQPIEHVYFHERGYTSVGRQVGALAPDKYAGTVAVLPAGRGRGAGPHGRHKAGLWER